MRYSDPYDDDGGLEIDLYPGIQKLSGRTAIKEFSFTVKTDMPIAKMLKAP